MPGGKTGLPPLSGTSRMRKSENNIIIARRRIPVKFCELIPEYEFYGGKRSPFSGTSAERQAEDNLKNNREGWRMCKKKRGAAPFFSGGG